MEITAEVEKALSLAKIGLMTNKNSAFFSSVCLSLKHQFVNDPAIPTAATDGINIFYSPAFFMNESKAKRIGLIFHETMHVAFKHNLRLGTRNHEKFNRACDYVINLIAVDAGFELPDCGLLDRKYAGMSAEEVYDLLPDEPGDFKMKDLLLPGDLGGLSDRKPGDEKTVEAKIDDILVTASVQSKMSGDKPGSIPGALQREIDKLLNPEVPWQKLLRAYFTAVGKSEYSYRKPNRRFLNTCLLPSLHSEAMGGLATAADVSGSVNDHEFTHYISEQAGLIRSLKPSFIDFIMFDTQIKSVTRVKTLTEITNVDFHGRGGTRIDPIMEWAQENKPSVLVIFTDGRFTSAKIDPKCPVIWVIYDYKKFKAPFGRVVHYNKQPARK